MRISSPKLLEFNVGDKVFLKFSWMKGVVKFCIQGKFNPRFISPFTIVERIGNIGHRLAIRVGCSAQVFHISRLGMHRRWEPCCGSFWCVIRNKFAFQLVATVDWRERVMKNKMIFLVLESWYVTHQGNPPGVGRWYPEEVSLLIWVIMSSILFIKLLIILVHACIYLYLSLFSFLFF